MSHGRGELKLSLWLMIRHLATVLLKQPFLFILADHSHCSNMLLFYGSRIPTLRSGLVEEKTTIL